MIDVNVSVAVVKILVFSIASVGSNVSCLATLGIVYPVLNTSKAAIIEGRTLKEVV